MWRTIHKRPTARQIQPTGLWGRLEATRAPTRGKTSKRTKPNRSLTAPAVAQPPGDREERAGTYSAMLATNVANERPASDQASQAAVRRLTGLAPSPRPRRPRQVDATTARRVRAVWSH